jgi:hypothetical protein
MLNNHWLSIIQHDSQPLAQLSTPWFTTTVSHSTSWFTYTGSEWHTKIHNHCLGRAHHDSQYSVPVDINHVVLFWASGCESWWVMLLPWLWIMVCYSEPVVVNHGELWWACVCESWCALPKQWLWILVWHSEPVYVNHDVLCSQHDSQPLAQLHTTWFTTTGPA